MEPIIVSRHAAAVAFIRAEAPEFATAQVIESATPEQVTGRRVAGNLPLHLAALAAEVIAVEFAGAPPRGTEYGLAEMRAAGARLVRYVVRGTGECLYCGSPATERLAGSPLCIDHWAALMHA